MGIRFACHECDKRLNVKRDLAGKRGVCPQCSTRFRIPTEDADHSTPIVDASSRAAGSTKATATSTRVASQSNDSASSIDLLVDDPASTWYVRPPTGGQYGPASSEVLRSWIDQGRVAATSLLWRDGWPQWRTASEVLPDLVQPSPDRDRPIAVETGVAGNGSAAIAPSEPVVVLGGRAELGH